jgi:soluble lytic murein transglycosylase-like protein
MRRRAALLLTLSIFSLGGAGPAQAAEPNVCEREMISASARFGVPLPVLYAVAMTETGSKDGLRPTVMNIDGKDYTASDVADGLRRFEAAKASGAKFIDIGCMQINHRFHGKEFRSVADMFDPHQNVQYAARFLQELRAREGSWTLAVARYNAGPNNDPAQKRYVCAVIRNMVASGFGGWTDGARKFCGT